MKKIFLPIVSILFLVAIVYFAMFYTKQENGLPEEIVFGYVGDMSKSGVKSMGVSCMHGFDIAVDEINKDGGILGKKIKPIILDDEADVDVAEKQINQLVFDDNAAVIIGPVNSYVALSWIHIPQENKVPVVVPLASDVNITKKYEDLDKNYIFRISVTDKEQQRLMMAWIAEKVNPSKVAVIFPTTMERRVDEMKELFAKYRQNFIASVSYERGDTDLSSQIDEIYNSGAEGVVYWTYADYSGHILNAFEGDPRGDLPAISTWANLDSNLWDIAGEEAEKLVFASSITRDKNEATKDLYNRILEKYGKTPVFPTAAHAYDAVKLIAAAIEKAGTIDGETVRDALENITNVQGVIKLYEKPFSKTQHEALFAEDMTYAIWKDGEVLQYKDEITSNIELKDW